MARGDPTLFRRRSSDARLAAAALWVVVKANRGFDHPEKFTVNDVVNHFDVAPNLTERGRTLLTAIGVKPGDLRRQRLTLGTPRYLVSSRRSWILHLRDLADAPRR